MPQEQRRQPRLGWLIGAVAWAGVIGWCTLQSNPGAVADIARLQWYCLVCGDNGVADVALNILLFLPLGVALSGLGWPLRRTVLVVAAMSTSIETIQGTLLIGRDAAVGDVLSNTSGGLLGWFACGGILQLLRPTLELARRGTALVLVIMAGLWFATAAGLQPSLTTADPWIGQPMHAGRGPVPFPGTMQQASIDGIVIHNEEMAQQAPWRDSIVIDLSVTRNSAELFDRGIVLLRIVDTAHVVEVAMDQRGDDAWLRLRLRAADWLLHYPRWQVPHAMRMTPGVPWRFRWKWERDRFTIANLPADSPLAITSSVPLSIGLGWSFIHPFVNTIGTNRLLWTTLWLGFWFGLLGWLAGRMAARWTMGVGVAALAIYVGTSLWWGMPLQAGEIVAAVGAFGGMAFGATTRRLSS